MITLFCPVDNAVSQQITICSALKWIGWKNFSMKNPPNKKPPSKNPPNKKIPQQKSRKQKTLQKIPQTENFPTKIPLDKNEGFF